MKDQSLHIVEHFGGLCCIKGCDLPVLAMGMCNKHWRRNRDLLRNGAHGSPVALGTKITEDIVISIRADTRLQKEIAEQYGLTQTTISDIKRRRSWAHVGCAIHADG